MPHATLTISSEPATGPGGQRWTIDCPHGATLAYFLPGTPMPTHDDILRPLLASHDAHERCGCTRRLWRKMRTAAPRCPERRSQMKKPVKGPKILDKTHFGGKK